MAFAPVPICGIGAICAAGLTPHTAFEKVRYGADALLPLTLFDSELKEPPLVAQVDTDLDSLAGKKLANRTLALALIASRQAIDPAHPPRRLGLVFATTVAGITRSELFYRDLLSNGSALNKAAQELACHEPTALAGVLARELGATGIHCLSTACSTGLHAAWLAALYVNAGVYDACLAVGADALSLLTIRGFASLTLLDPQGCRPFDSTRAGISLGEGAGALLFASTEYCRSSGKPVLGTLSGWGASADCYHMTAPHPDGDGARRSMLSALQSAQCQPEHVDLIIAHGTATPDNDLAESKAVRALFPTPPPICSLKRSLGHTLAASGTLEAVFGLLAMHEGSVPATGGFAQPDPAMQLTPSNCHSRPINRFIKNAFGFGGNNASVLFQRTGSN